MGQNQDFSRLTRQIRYDILRMTHGVGSGHPTSSFSAVELVTLLFFKYFRFDFSHPEAVGNDRLIFSKGHASALYYALYAAAGQITEGELLRYRTFDSPLEGHPTRRFRFTEAATGALGLGLSVAAGEAWALRLQTAESNVFVLLGDGELAEGANWEAAAWGGKQKLNNLVAVVDVNRLGQAGETAVGHDCEVYRRRFEAFGWAVIVIDGHDLGQIDAAYQKALDYKSGPSVIIGKTVKGKGVGVWEDRPGWHNKMLPPDELEKALAEYKMERRLTGRVIKPTPVSLRDSDLRDEAVPSSLVGIDTSGSGIGIRNDVYKLGTLVPTKKAWGDAVETLGGQLSELVVLDGDMANSTHADQFAVKYPGRFLQMYIAEQNMVGVAIGLSRRGYKPFVATFGAFWSRAHDQLRMAPLNGVSLYVNGSYVGVSLGRDGPSQMALEDLGLFRSISGSTVLYPADAVSTAKLTKEMLRNTGVNYIRTTREPTPVIYAPGEKFPIGGSKVHKPTPGVGLMITLVAAGITLHEALKAQKSLEADNVPVRVVDCYSVKPIDKSGLQQVAGNSRAIVVVEDHYPEGGLGEAVLSALAEAPHPPIIHLAVTQLPRSGSSQELLDWAGISASGIVKAVRKILA